VLVIRDIAWFYGGTAPTSLDVAVAVSGSPTAFALVVVDPAQFAVGHWEGRAVIPFGQQLYVTAGTADWTCWVSGYELVGT
jgi:hypothetical protein